MVIGATDTGSWQSIHFRILTHFHLQNFAHPRNLVACKMQPALFQLVIVYDEVAEGHRIAFLDPVNGSITIGSSIPVPKWSAVIYSQGDF